jgi:nucleotide-binding universal stress UspA family protein
MGEVLVGVDFSDATDRVVAVAVQLVAGTERPVRLVHVAAAESVPVVVVPASPATTT